MNTLNAFQHCLLAVTLVGAAVCLATVLAYHFRNQLLELHERWLGLGPLGRVVSILAVTVAVLYGGTKSPTNDLAGATGAGATGAGATGVSPVAGLAGTTGTGATGVSPVAEGGTDGQDAHRPSAFRPMTAMPLQQPEPNHLCSPSPSAFTSLTAWNKRGAYSDWQRIDFPDDFAFPHGTNLLTSVTLFAWGEIREEVKVRGEGEQRICDHHCSPSPSIFTFPAPLSLEPGASSVTYGLTPSNSFLIAWQNACVNRDATNRVDASIKLFRNGAMATTVIPLSTPTPPTYTYIPAVPPPGYVGSDQDNAWALAAFPDDYDVITNKGYEAWLDEDYVGINEQNGHYKATITINQQPTTNTQAPLYLVCGPYKVVVTSPGTYSFPLEVFETYKVRTYPIALPLSISTDDGYRGSLLFGSPVLTASRVSSVALAKGDPRLVLSASPSNSFEYEIREEPRLVLSPSSIPLSQAAGTVISIWCNITEGARRLYTSLSGWTTVTFRCPSEAEIEESMVEDAVEFILETSKGSCSGTVYIEDETDGCCWDCCGPDCRCDGTCCDCTCGCHD